MFAILWCIFCLLFALFWLSSKKILTETLFIIIIGSWVGSLLGAYIYSVLIHADNMLYFFYDSGFGLSTAFVGWLTHMIKPLANNSSLLTSFVFSMFGFLAQVTLLVLFFELSKTQTSKRNSFCFLSSSNGRRLSILLMLWPPFLFWGSLLGKDSLQFMLIILFLYSCFIQKGTLSYVIAAFVLILEVLVRPYMLCVILLSYFLCVLIQKKATLYKFIALIICMIGGLIAVHVMQTKYGVNILNLDSVVHRSYVQQIAQSKGTALNVFWQPTGISYWLALPWVFFANSFLPLPGLYTTNAHAWLSAIMNVFLLYVCIYVVLRLKQMKALFKPWLYNRILFMLIWSFFGMLLITLVNTNLGLAARQKIPYVGMVFIIYGLLKFKFWEIKHRQNK